MFLRNWIKTKQINGTHFKILICNNFNSSYRKCKIFQGILTYSSCHSKILQTGCLKQRVYVFQVRESESLRSRSHHSLVLVRALFLSCRALSSPVSSSGFPWWVPMRRGKERDCSLFPLYISSPVLLD